MADYQDQYGNGFDQSFGWFFSNWGPSLIVMELQDGVIKLQSTERCLGKQVLKHPFATASSATGIPAIRDRFGLDQNSVYEWKPYNNVEAFFRTGTIINTNMNLKGASDDGKVSYNFNVGHLDDEGFTLVTNYAELH